MANSGATLVVQRELLPAQSSSTSLSAFPSLLGTGEDGEEDGERGELDEKGEVERGEEVVLGMVTSSMAAQGEPPEQPDHPYQCLDCGKSFKWSSRLTHHQRSHTDERPYRCNLCPKAFKGSSALLYHQRSHSGEKPYKCQDCGKAFKRSSLLQVHQSVHTGLRTFLCPYCALTFKWSSHYQYHLRQHTGECPYLCDSCPKAFKNSSSLRRHKNVHLGLKPYVCTVCNKAFTQSTNLRQHMRIHTGERPYVCKECGRSFTHSSNLALHKNSHANSVTSAVNGEERHAGNNPGVEVVVGSEEEASSMLSDIVGFVSQEGTVGVGVEEVFLSTTAQGQGQGQSLLPQLSFTSSGGGMCSSRAIGTELHLSTDTGASVLLYSCGSCNQTFSTRTELEDHQSIHMGPGGDQVAEGEAGGEAGMDVGVGHLLADFEEVVETTTVAENGHSAEELLGLTGGNDGTNVGTSQAQFDLLQSFTEVTQSSGGPPAARTSESGLQCGYCNKSFKTSGGLNRHVSLGRSTTCIHSLTSQSRSQFSCSACDRSFPLLTSLLTHQHSHTPEQRLLAEAEAEIVCPPSLSLSLPMPSSPSQAEKQPEEEEGQTEVHVNLIRVGEGEQQPAKPARMTRKGGANKNIAAGDRPYRCSECGKAFKGSSGLRYHMRDHTGERPYRCTECGKSFKRSSLLSIHQRVHTGVRAFQCPHCPLTFKWSSHYQYHLRQHTGERPYVCKECGKSFKNTSCLRRHSQMHSGLRPHTCSICSKSFSQTSNLKQHERTHSGERPFQCTHCSKSFTHSSNLQLHLRTHSTRKDFKCPYCSKEFVMHSYLQRHIRTHGNGATLLCAEPQGKEASGAGQGVTTTTTTMTTSTLLNPITLETTGSSGSLIVSQPALDIPPNTSQNYFMIQTARGLQLIPLSAPTPTPPPAPPPPQTQNYVLLQCPSTGSSQGNLILVATATNAPPAREAEALPLVQTVMGFQSVVSPTRLPHFQTVSPQQQQTKFILSNTLNNSKNHGNTPVAMPTRPLSSNSLLSRPILGRSTRTARGRRGRKPKAALQNAAPPVPGAAAVSNLTRPTPPTVTDAAAGPNSAAAPSSLAASAGSSSTSPAFAPSSSTSAAVTTATSDPQSIASGLVQSPSGNPSTLPLLSSAAVSGEPPAALEELRTDESVSGKQLVLCFENEGERKERASVKVGHGESFVLQFAREGSGETGEGVGVSGQGKSFVLRFNTNGESGVDEPGDKSEVVSLLEGWGAEREGERPSGEGGGQSEPFVLHFQTEQQDGSPSNTAYSQGLNNSLSCTPTQDLVPLNRQEVVFELGEETKLGQDSGGSMQMITLIQAEGGGEEGSCGGAGGEGQDGRGTMESIYQLEGGEGIVIIEVSTSSLSEEQMERGGEREPTEKVGSETTEMKEQSEKVVNSTMKEKGD